MTTPTYHLFGLGFRTWESLWSVYFETKIKALVGLCILFLEFRVMFQTQSVADSIQLPVVVGLRSLFFAGCWPMAPLSNFRFSIMCLVHMPPHTSISLSSWKLQILIRISMVNSCILKSFPFCWTQSWQINNLIKAELFYHVHSSSWYQEKEEEILESFSEFCFSREPTS